jgi:hypothetical protein
LLNELVSPSADVFSWASVVIFCFNRQPFFDAKTIEIQMRHIQGKRLPALIPDELRQVVATSMHIDASCRPSVDEIVKSKAFLQMSVRSLRFLDNILLRTPAERSDFYTKLVPTLPIFSDRILRHHLYPLFMSELISDERYAPVLVPLIFHIGKRYAPAEFMNEILNPLRHVFKRTVPEELGFANLSVTPIILDRVAVEQQCEVLYPLFIASLQSPSAGLRGEALKHIPGMIASMSEEIIQRTLMPTLLEFIDEARDLSVCCSVIECLGQCLAKVHPDAFCECVVPKLLICWQRVRVPQLAVAIEFLLRKMRPSPLAVSKYVVPIAAEILASRQAGAATENALIAIINGSMDKIITERNLIARAANWRDDGVLDREIVTPIQVAALDLDRQRERERFRRRAPGEEIVRGRHGSDAGAVVGVPLPQFSRQRQNSDNVGMADRPPPAVPPQGVVEPRMLPNPMRKLSLFSGMSLDGTKQ